MPRFVVRSPMPASAQALHDWHAREGAFARLVPPWDDVRVVRSEGPFPTRRVELAMGPIRWVAQHRDHVPGRQFVDEQVSGPFRRWVHTHRFVPDGDQSVLEDEVDWEGTLPALGTLFSGGVEATLQRLFAWRHARTRGDLERHAGVAPQVLAISGSRGLLGEALVPFLTTGGHEVRRLVRGGGGGIPWDPVAGQLDAAALDGVDTFLHLSGEPINQRWTAASRREILESRTRSTTLVARTLAGMPRPPALVCASAVGYYGHREDWVDVGDAPGAGFAAEVCQAWEAACQPARDAGVRVVNVRIGVVLSARGGALAQLLPPFRAGLGGVVGSGKQWFPWVHVDDLLGILLRACVAGEGPVNGVAPNPVTNAELTRTLGAVLGRPTVVPVPAFGVKLVFGEMGERLLLEGARVRAPAGQPFQFPTLEAALRGELGA